MSLTIDNVVRVGRGSAPTSSTSTAIDVTLDASGVTDADSVVVVGLFGEGVTFATPSGWAVIGVPTSGLSLYRRGPVEGLIAGESSWSFTPSATAGKAVTATAMEVSGVDPDLTVNVVEDSITTLTAGEYKTSDTPTTSIYDGLAVAFFAIRDSAAATVHTWDGYWKIYNPPPDPTYIGPWDEVVEQGQAGTGNSVALAAAIKTVSSITAPVVSGVPSTTLDATRPAVSIAFVLRAIGAVTASDFNSVDGAEHGLVTGNTLGTSAYRVLTSVTAGVTVDAAAARSGSYGWKLTSSAAACNFTRDNVPGSSGAWRRAFRFPTLPAADLIFWSVTANTPGGSACNVSFVAATSKLRVQISTGTAVDSDAAITANQWFAVDLCYNITTAGTDFADWSVDYNAELTDTTIGVPQTQAVGTANSTSNFLAERVGWTAAGTATLHTDDGGIAPNHNYPVGDLRVLPLKVDPAGTPTVSGTTTNFGVMTGDGSVAAWNATNARNAVDDVPPDLSGTRDAAVCILAHATDYAEFPMDTYDLAANRVAVRAARFIGSVWAASGTAATIRVFVFDGTDTYTVFPEADPPADNAATPAWICRMIRPATGVPLWTQPLVDGLAVRIGSNDANPDIGLDCMLIELGVIKAQPESLFGEAGEPIYVEAHRDPDTLALVGATVDNNSGDPIKLAWEVDGVPDETSSISDGTTDLYVPLSADGSIETVNWVSVIPG